MQNHLKEILLALAEAKVDFVVAGGVAVVLHGVERLTLDLDLALKMTKENLDRFLQTIHKLELQPRVPVSAETLTDPESIQRIVREKGALVFSFVDLNQPIRQLDVFLTKDLSYDQLAQDALAIELDGNRIKIASLEKMLEIKKGIGSPREKDLTDIRELERLKQQRRTTS